MSAPTANAQPRGLPPATTDDRAVPAHARQLAARLSALFQRDVEIVKQLNNAHHRLAHANQHLYAGPILDAPQQIHWQIHHAFCTYQHASEQRRQLAIEVGEHSQQLIDALCAAGWSAQQARQANVHQLAEPPHPPPGREALLSSRPVLPADRGDHATQRQGERLHVATPSRSSKR